MATKKVSVSWESDVVPGEVFNSKEECQIFDSLCEDSSASDETLEIYRNISQHIWKHRDNFVSILAESKKNSQKSS